MHAARSSEVRDDTAAIFARLQAGSKRHEYNVGELEISIDRLRQLRDWPAVGALIKRYAHVFDIGCVSEGGTNFTGERSRAYYWVVMAEVMIYQNKDLQNAGFCITRSAERDPDFGLWRIVLVKILLLRTKKLAHHPVVSIKSLSSSDSDSENVKSPKSPNGGGIQTEEHDKAMKQLDVAERALIQTSLDSFKPAHRKAILSAFSALPSDEILRIFMEILVRFNHLKLDPQAMDARIQWVFIICKKVLQNIHITDYYQQFLDQQLSEHNFWMVLDAISTRSLIREICGDMQQARSDIQQLVHVVVKQYSHSLRKLPEPIRTSLLFTCCRLPILEKIMNLPSSSLQSFRFCVSGDSIVAPHLSDTVKIALSITAADMMIQLAFSNHHKGNKHYHSNVEVKPTTSRKGKKKADSPPTESTENLDSVPDIVNHAYMLLVQVKDMLLTTSEDDGSCDGMSAGSSTNFITHHPSSLINDLRDRLGSDYVRACRSDPGSLFEASPTRAIASEHIAVLLAAVMGYLKVKNSNVGDVGSVLTWALAMSTKPSYDLLWNVSQLYLSPEVNKLNEAVSLMQQCSERKAMTTGIEESRTISERSELCAWLGLGVQVHKYSALPALKCALTCLHGLGNPKKAVEVSLHGLNKCAGVGGVRCSSLIQRKLDEIDHGTVSSFPVGINNRQCILTLSFMSTLGSTAVNIFQFVLLVAKSFAALSRFSDACPHQRLLWSRKSSLMFDLLESTELRDIFDTLPACDEDDWSFEDQFYSKCRFQALSSHVLDYSALLAEAGQISSSINRLKVFLGEVDENDTTTGDISSHLHLLAVLMASQTGLGCETAVTLCKKAILVNKSLTTTSSLRLANLQLTLASFLGGRSERNNAILLLDHICATVLASTDIPDHTELYSSSMQYPFQQELYKVSLLLECSGGFRTCDELDKAQVCIEEAWLILHSPNLSQFVTLPRQENNSTEFAAQSTKRNRHAHVYRDEAKRINEARGTPTLRGWRLPSGTGWGLAETFENGFLGRSTEDVQEFSSSRTKYRSFEADLFAECGQVLMCRGEKKREIAGDLESINEYDEAAAEVLAMALAVDPNHFRSKLLTAKLCVASIERKVPGMRLIEDILRANTCAQAALRENDKSADAWALVGRCQGLLGLVDESVNALLSSIECQHLSFVRPIQHVMY